MTEEKDYLELRGLVAIIDEFEGRYNKVTLDRVTNRLKYRDSFYGIGEYDKNVSDEEIYRFIDGLRECRVLNWHLTYHNTYVLDGINWSVKIEFEDGSVERTGSNAYPEIWKTFCIIVENLAGKPFGG